jgi:hypothetical protein
MPQLLIGLLASAAFALGANHIYTKWGARALWATAAIVAVLLWGTSRLKPVIVTSSLDGRPYAFFIAVYYLWAFAIAVLSIQAWALTKSNPYARAALAGAAAFVVWLGGGFIS